MRAAESTDVDERAANTMLTPERQVTRRRLVEYLPSIAPFLLFAVLVLGISYRVMPNRGVLMYNDYPFYWSRRAFDPLSVVQSSFLGYVRLVGAQATLLTGPPQFLSHFLPASFISYLTTYGLIYACGLTYYFVAKRLTQSIAIGYVAGVFAILNNVVLEYIVVQPSHIFVALIIYALTLYLVVTRKNSFRPRHAVVLGLMSLGLTHPFFWAMELLLISAVLIALIRPWRQLLVSGLVALGSICVLGAYWLLPFLVGASASSTADLYAGNQSSVFEGVKAKIHYLQAFDLSQYPGTWQNSIYRGHIPHTFYFATVAIIVGAFIKWGRYSARRRILLTLLGSYLITLSLGLGPNSAATGRLWTLAYDHVPGFGFFRTFSRFLTLSLVALVALVVYTLHDLRRDHPRYFQQATAIFIVCLAASHWPLFTGNVNGTAVAAHVPTAYSDFNKRFLDTADSFSVVTYPNVYYESYQWAINSNLQAYQQITYFKELFLDQAVIFNRLALNDLNLDAPYFPRLFDYYTTFRFYPEFDADLNQLDVKYVLIHKDLFDIQRVIDNVPSGKGNAQLHQLGLVPFLPYLDYFSHSPKYRLVDDNPYFAVYANLQFQPRIRSQNVSYQRVTDTEYRVHVSRLKAPRELALLQRFDSRWSIYAKRSTAGDWCEPVASYKGGLTECAGLGADQLLRQLRLTPRGRALDIPHTRSLGYANTWLLDPASLRTQLSSSSYVSNNDGSIDADFVIYFRPQASFSIGCAVSIVVALGCAVYLVLTPKRRRRLVGLVRRKSAD